MASSVKRGDYVRALVQQAGLTYVEAERVYTVLMGFFADALASQRTICIGRIGALKPRQIQPRRVTMGFKREGGRVEKVRREYHVGLKTKYVFKAHRAFAEKHGLSP